MNENNTNFIEAKFVKRINRFVSIVHLKDKDIHIYIPNTDRLSELTIPGRKVILVPSRGKYKYKILYIFHNDFPVMIDSVLSNRLFFDLLSYKRVPDME